MGKKERAKPRRKKKNDIEKKADKTYTQLPRSFLSLPLVWKDWKWKFRDGIAGFYDECDGIYELDLEGVFFLLLSAFLSSSRIFLCLF